MICPHHQFVFVHITKTAGTSIEFALRDYLSSLCAEAPQPYKMQELPGYFEGPQHADFRAMIAARPELEKYRGFAFLRNPWARLVSLYIHHRRGPEAQHQLFMREQISFSDYLFDRKSFGLKNTRESGRNPDQLSWLESRP